MARKRTNVVKIAIAAGDSERLRKLAARARTPETGMLQLLVADLIERQKRFHRRNSNLADHPRRIGAV